VFKLKGLYRTAGSRGRKKAVNRHWLSNGEGGKKSEKKRRGRAFYNVSHGASLLLEKTRKGASNSG